MYIQIRDAVFETNSSSSHSVTVSADELADDYGISKETLRKGVITAKVYPDGYGWEWVRFYRPENKLAYLLYQAMPWTTRGKEPERGVDVASKLKEVSPRARHIIETVEKKTGLRVELVFPDVEGAHFYVDDDSAGRGLEYTAPGREDELLRLIFGSNSYVELGNDNYEPGEYIASDIGEIHSCPDKMLDEPLDEEATFMADFSLGLGDTDSQFIDADGEAHTGVLSMGWMQSILCDLKGATLTDVHVAYAPERFNSLGEMRTPVGEQARESFFRWLNGKNKVEDWRDYGEEGPTDIRLLRGFRFGFEEVVSKRGGGDHDDMTRFTVSGVGSRAQIEDIASQFDRLLERSEEMRSRNPG
jgi:hypothetical protein